MVAASASAMAEAASMVVVVAVVTMTARSCRHWRRLDRRSCRRARPGTNPGVLARSCFVVWACLAKSCFVFFPSRQVMLRFFSRNRVWHSYNNLPPARSGKPMG